MKRHFKVQTAAGFEDIYCNDMDDCKPGEVWFVFTELPPRIFRRTAILSIQEIPVLTLEQEQARQAAWDRLVEENQLPEETYGAQ